MTTVNLLCTGLVLAGMSLLAQAQTAEPAAKTAPIPNPSIQVTAHQGTHQGGETQKVTLSPESSRLLLRNWQMAKLTDEGGTVLQQQKPEERDRFRFQEGNILNVVKKGYAAEGYWKFSPESGQLIITDQSRSQQVSYTVLLVTSEELVMHFEDELNGSKVLYFVPAP